MRKFFSRRSGSLVVLPIFTLALAWNLVHGAGLPASSHQLLRVVEGQANQIATGPTLPPPCTDGCCITTPAPFPSANQGATHTATGPTLPPPCTDGGCITTPAPFLQSANQGATYTATGPTL